MGNFYIKPRLDIDYKVSFPDFPSFSAIPQKVTIHQEMGNHDIVELVFTQYDRFYTEVFATGTPVQLRWNNGDFEGKFFGYLSTVEAVTQKGALRPIKMVCIGATFPLKQRGNKIWKNKTASQIVKDISKSFKFKAKVTESEVKFKQQSMVGHTYWQKLNELARRVGYAVHAVNTTIYFKSIDDMIMEFSSSIPVLQFFAAWDTDKISAPNSLDYFHPVLGDYVETGFHKKTTKQITGVNPLTGKVYTKLTAPNSTGKSIRQKNKDPLFLENDPWSVADSSEMSSHLSKGRASLGRLHITAQGSAIGDPRIAPWRTIEVDGTGNASDGFWLVKKATHTLSINRKYTVDFTCVTDGTGFNQTGTLRPTTGSLTETRNIKQEVISGTTKPPKTVLSGSGSMLKETDNGFHLVPRRWVGE